MPESMWPRQAHGLSRTTEYRSWVHMRERCCNPSHHAYSSYGGRGIKVDPDWMQFSTFLSDMGQKPSPSHQLDRIDNDAGYSKDNCRWATHSENSLNRRSARMIEAFGRTANLSVWARRAGIGVKTMQLRLKAGMSITEAMFLPLRKGNRSWHVGEVSCG